MPVRLPPGRARLVTRPPATGSSPTLKTIGIVEVALFAASAAGMPPCHDHVDLAADEIGGQCGQPIIVGPPPSGIRSPRFVPRHSRFRSAPGGTRPHIGAFGPGESPPRIADHRHRLLLRAQPRAPPSSRRPAGDELAAVHSMTSSARARIDGGTVRPSALAVLRLTTSSNVVGCWTGRSAGLAPLRILPA